MAGKIVLSGVGDHRASMVEIGGRIGRGEELFIPFVSTVKEWIT